MADVPSPDRCSLHSLSPARTSDRLVRRCSSADDLLSDGQVVRVTIGGAGSCNYKSIVVRIMRSAVGVMTH